MADVTGDNYAKTHQSGEYGNCNMAMMKHTLAAVASADIVVFGKLPGASNIVEAVLRNAALGGSTTMSLGYRYIDSGDGSTDATAWLSAQATSSAARTVSSAAPVLIASGKGVEIIGTVGGATATGVAYAMFLYEWIGQ